MLPRRAPSALGAVLLNDGAPPQVDLGKEGAAVAAEAIAVDLEVLEHALHVVSRLREWDALDPVDHIDVRLARIAVGIDPFLHVAAAGIVGGEDEDQRAAP